MMNNKHSQASVCCMDKDGVSWRSPMYSNYLVNELATMGVPLHTDTETPLLSPHV